MRTLQKNHFFILVIILNLFYFSCSKKMSEQALEMASQPDEQTDFSNNETAPVEEIVESAPPEETVVDTPAAIIRDDSDATPKWEMKVRDGKSWTASVLTNLDTLGIDLLDVIPADTEDFCPNYKNLDLLSRKKFWTFLISSMVQFESGFNTNSKYQESFADQNGKPVISRGLLQISIESSKGYACGFKTDTELHEPLKNLNCGIRILNKWLGTDGRFAGKVSTKWRGGARYWSVLRAGDKTSYKSITTWSKNLRMCRTTI